MRKQIFNAKAPVDWLVPLGKELFMIENAALSNFNHLRVLGEQVMRLLGAALQKEAESGYRIYGKYRVRETFAGEESITSLLTQYVERTISMRC